MEVALFYKDKEVKDPLYSRIEMGEITDGMQVVFPSTKAPYLFDEVRVFDDEGDLVETTSLSNLYDVVIQVRANF